MDKPTPSQIRGTLENVYGTALSDVSFDPKTGTIVVAYLGETDVDWDSQETVDDERGRIFIDEDGRRHHEADLRALWSSR